ncbi:MAG: STAS domain-containing protein [Chlamydiia bacterium]|nr:STAS domain-containing protein [Chlamydiia bacterium]
MNIVQEKKGQVLILHLSGTLAGTDAEEVEKEIFQLIQQGTHKFVLDLGEISSVDEEGLRMLSSVEKKLRGLSGKLLLSSVSEFVKKKIKECGFGHLFEFSESEDQALQKCL